MKLFAVLLLVAMSISSSSAQNRPRARDLGVPFEGSTGPLNTITDVPGVEVGHRTLISGERLRAAGLGVILALRI